MATTARKEGQPATSTGTSSSAAPTARYLQARIDVLRTTLIQRLENIFAAAIDDSSNVADPSNDRSDDAVSASAGPTLTDTAAKQLQIDVDTTALVRAAEEIMMLTRTMKELWLFGGLDTIRGRPELDGEEPERDKKDTDDDEARRTAEDEKTVVQEFIKHLAGMNANPTDQS